MAVYRQVQITFWQDPFILELLPEEKYFYLYLLTNSKTTQCGIYEISEMIIKLETGLEKEKVKELLSKFVEYKKIEYDLGTNEIFILNWLKFNPIKNINIEKCVLKELDLVKSEKFIRDFLIQCLELKFEIPRLQGAYKGLAMGGAWNNITMNCPCKKEEEEEEKEKEKEETKEETKEKEEEREHCDSCSENKDTYKLYEKCGFGLLNQILIELIDTDIEYYTKEWVEESMREAIRQNKYKYSYVEGILRNWKTNGKEKVHGKSSQCTEDPNREGIGFELGVD